MRKNRIACLALALALALALLPATAQAATEVIPCVYDFAHDFREGLAAVERDGQFAFIDKTGREVVPFRPYGQAGDFCEGLAMVERGGKWGFIDKAGNEVVPLQYDWVWDFCEGLALVGRNDRYGFVDKAGREVVPIKYDSACSFSEGLASVGLDGAYGFIDKTGKEVIPLRYNAVYDFSEGLALVQIRIGDEPENGFPYAWAFIDKTGKAVVPFGQYGYHNAVGNASFFSEGLAPVCEGIDKYGRNLGKWGFIDRTGKLVIPCRYDSLPDWMEGFSEGLAAVIDSSGEAGFIDKTGKLVIPCQYSLWRGRFRDGLTMVHDDSFRCGFIDKTGRQVVPCRYDYVDEATIFCEGFARMRRDGKWGFIDRTGREAVPFRYEHAADVSEGLARVQLNGKWGFLSPGAAGAVKMAYAATQTVQVDGRPVVFQMYARRDVNGDPVNYIKVRDLALALNGTKAQFDVGYDGAVNLIPGRPYTPNGSEMRTPFSGDRPYTTPKEATRVNGQPSKLKAILLSSDSGGGFTYYKLRNLGKALGFNVGWSKERGVYVETDKPYSGS